MGNLYNSNNKQNNIKLGYGRRGHDGVAGDIESVWISRETRTQTEEENQKTSTSNSTQ